MEHCDFGQNTNTYPKSMVKKDTEKIMATMTRKEAADLATKANDLNELRASFQAAGVELMVLEFAGRCSGETATASFKEVSTIYNKRRELGRYFINSLAKPGAVIHFSLQDRRQFLVVWSKLDLRYDLSGSTEFDTHSLALVPVECLEGWP